MVDTVAATRRGPRIIYAFCILSLCILQFISRPPYTPSNCDIFERVEFPTKKERKIVPLAELVGSLKEVECEDPLVLVKDVLLNPKLAFDGGRKIPKIVHVTSRSRCMNKLFADNLNTWHLKDHSFFMHDDEAMDKLLYRDWPEFPQLQHVLRCLKHGGAVKADVWRILVLWEYGGIYTDIDNRPALFNADTITAEDDAFFVMDVL